MSHPPPPRHRNARQAGVRARSLAAFALLVLGPFLLLASAPSSAAPTAGWQRAGLLETDNAGYALNPDVAADGLGDAFAVWKQSDGTRDNVWANRYTEGSGWGSATLIETDNSGSAGMPRVACDAAGDAIAVWYQSDGSRNNIWANRYAAGAGWGTASLIETMNADSAFDPRVAVDRSGDATAVWHQSNGTRYDIWANRYTVGSGWGTAALIETNDAADALLPVVAGDGNGTEVAVWQQSNGTRNDIWANRYVAGSGWGNATLIEQDNTDPATSPDVGVDASGDAVAVWYQQNGSRADVWANRYAAGVGWGNATLIETDTVQTAALPYVAVDAAGDAVAVWEQYDAVRWNLWTNRYVAGSGWQSATLVETSDAGSVTSWRVAGDAGGDAIAVWIQPSGTTNVVWANRYAAGVGWGGAQIIESDLGSARGADVAFGAGGNAFAVWVEFDFTVNNIWGSRYVAQDSTPPALAVTAPGNGTSTNVSSAWVEGLTEPGAQVYVGGYAASVAANGSFRVLVPLQPGPNAIVTVVSDAWGNVATNTTSVSYDDPLPALLAEVAAAQSDRDAAVAALADAQARADTLQALANRTQADLDAAIANLTAAQAQVAQLDTQAAVAQADLAAARANLTAAQANVTSLQADANATAADLASARAELAAAVSREAALELTLNATLDEKDAALAGLNASQARVAVLQGSLNQTAEDLAAAQAAVAAAQNETNSTQGAVPPQAAASTLGFVVGLVGLAAGAAGVALAVRARRSRDAAQAPGADEAGASPPRKQ